MNGGFHAHAGWYFTRTENGAVRITALDGTEPGTLYAAETELDPDTWAAVVAAVSARGENPTTAALARTFHDLPR